MMTSTKRLSDLEKARKKKSMPTPDTSRRLRARLDAGRERARAALQVHGLSLPSDEELLLSIPAGTFEGMDRTQIQVFILHRGRQRAYRRFAARKAAKDPADKKLASSSQLAKRE